MLATLSKLALMDPNLPTGIIGKSISEVQSIEWVQRWSEVKQVFIADFNGDGILQLNEWFMRGDVVVLATPEVAGLPFVISGLVFAGGMAAAMSTADGLVSRGLGDVYKRQYHQQTLDLRLRTVDPLLLE